MPKTKDVFQALSDVIMRKIVETMSKKGPCTRRELGALCLKDKPQTSAQLLGQKIKTLYEIGIIPDKNSINGYMVIKLPLQAAVTFIAHVVVKYNQNRSYNRSTKTNNQPKS